MGVYYERVYHLNGKVLIFDPQDGVPAGLENSYLINHSASIFLINPEGKMHAVFTTPHEPEVMIRDLAAIQGAWR
jgi:protein SCO1/2